MSRWQKPPKEGRFCLGSRLWRISVHHGGGEFMTGRAYSRISSHVRWPRSRVQIKNQTSSKAHPWCPMSTSHSLSPEAPTIFRKHKVGTKYSEHESMGDINESSHGESSWVSSNACTYHSHCTCHDALAMHAHTVLFPCSLRTPPVCLCSLRSFRTLPGMWHSLMVNEWDSTINFPTCKNGWSKNSK